MTLWTAPAGTKPNNQAAWTLIGYTQKENIMSNVTPIHFRHKTTGQDVEAVHATTDDVLRALRNDPWTDGAVKLLTYPSRVQAWVGVDYPLTAWGNILPSGSWLIKGPAGDFAVVTAEKIESDYEVAA